MEFLISERDKLIRTRRSAVNGFFFFFTSIINTPEYGQIFAKDYLGAKHVK